jgi:hypothetical protein
MAIHLTYSSEIHFNIVTIYVVTIDEVWIGECVC